MWGYQARGGASSYSIPGRWVGSSPSRYALRMPTAQTPSRPPSHLRCCCAGPTYAWGPPLGVPSWVSHGAISSFLVSSKGLLSTWIIQRRADWSRMCRCTPPEMGHGVNGGGGVGGGTVFLYPRIRHWTPPRRTSDLARRALPQGQLRHHPPHPKAPPTGEQGYYCGLLTLYAAWPPLLPWERLMVGVESSPLSAELKLCLPPCLKRNAILPTTAPTTKDTNYETSRPFSFP